MKTEGDDFAFSGVEHNYNNYGVSCINTIPGLTKREYFAAMAMQGFLASSVSINNTNERTPKLIASVAVITADALIEALNK